MKFLTFVNEKKNTVAVKVEDAKTEYLVEFCNFYKKYNMYPDMSLFDEFLTAYGEQIDKMIGIATCNVEAGDNFNVVFGEALARERYLKVFETYRINMYDMMVAKIDNMTASAFSKMTNCDLRRKERADKIKNKIESLKGNE